MIPNDLVRALGRLARKAPLLVATDYDGVLSPIVDDPSAAIPDRAALDSFVRAARHETVIPVIVSGRSREVLEGFVGDIPGVELIGNHGADLDAAGTDPAAAVVADRLAVLASEYPGARVEPKPFGAAFHYRNAEDRIGARDAARRVAVQLPGRIVEGKEVVEVVVGEATKGTAIAKMRSRTRAEAVLYLGDDVTDEDVFVSLEASDVGVKVGLGETVAPHRIDSVYDVAAVFAILDRRLSSVDDEDRAHAEEPPDAHERDG